MYKYESKAGVTLHVSFGIVENMRLRNGTQCNIKWKMAAISYEKLYSLKLAVIN
jgi:hypothetical protein